MQSPLYLFAYGTLKRGHYNHELLHRARYIADVMTKHPYPMVQLDEPFPYLLDKEGEGRRVKGELYQIDIDTLKTLDILEGCPEHYYRREIKVETMGITVRAIAYFKTDAVDYKDSELLEEFV